MLPAGSFYRFHATSEEPLVLLRVGCFTKERGDLKERIAIDGERAWIRNIISSDDAVVSLTECCWRVDEQEQDQRIGRLLREEPIHHKTGAEAPVEPRRIDRISPDEGEPAVAPQGG